MGSHSSTRRTVWLVARSSRENGVIRARLALSRARSPGTLRMRTRRPVIPAARCSAASRVGAEQRLVLGVGQPGHEPVDGGTLEVAGAYLH